METTPWWKQKTTWTGIVAIATAVGAYLTGEMELQTFIEAIFGALMVIFMRQGIAKISK